MKLFLLNTMKNKEPRKISLTFLGIFYHFLQLFKFYWKRKRKNSNSDGPIPAQAAQVQGKTRPRALAVLRKGPRLTDQSEVGSITIALSRWWFAEKPFTFYSFTAPGPRRCTTRQSSGELVGRSIGASTGALRWSKPNSGPSEGFP